MCNQAQQATDFQLSSYSGYVIARSAVQSSTQTRIHNAILFIETSNNASYNQVHWLFMTPYLAIKASNVMAVFTRKYTLVHTNF